MEFRIEHDTMGDLRVPADKYWGAQTQRSKENFAIGGQLMLREVIQAFAILKKAAALTNLEAGVQSQDKRERITAVCDEILAGQHDGQFTLVVWQTGSGTQSNMNVNEVIANRAHVLSGGKLTDAKKAVHPKDDMNKSQSSNDTFPSAMHLAAYRMLMKHTLPKAQDLRDTRQSEQYRDVVKAPT